MSLNADDILVLRLAFAAEFNEKQRKKVEELNKKITENTFEYETDVKTINVIEVDILHKILDEVFG